LDFANAELEYPSAPKLQTLLLLALSAPVTTPGHSLPFTDTTSEENLMHLMILEKEKPTSVIAKIEADFIPAVGNTMVVNDSWWIVMAVSHRLVDNHPPLHLIEVEPTSASQIYPPDARNQQ
jgi:hypothetical protein